MMSLLGCLFGLLWNLGPMEWLIIAVIILLLFGDRVPRMMRSLGRGVTEFKKGIKEDVEHTDDKDERTST